MSATIGIVACNEFCICALLFTSQNWVRSFIFKCINSSNSSTLNVAFSEDDGNHSVNETSGMCFPLQLLPIHFTTCYEEGKSVAICFIPYCMRKCFFSSAWATKFRGFLKTCNTSVLMDDSC